jgi:hypothetical protein
MLLTSPNRILTYLGLPLTDRGQTRNAMDWATSLSQRIENFLNRSLELKSYVQDFDTDFTRYEFFPKSVPIISVTSLKFDSLSVFGAGVADLVEETDFVIGINSRSILLKRQLFPALKSLRLSYEAGLATHAVNSIFAITSDVALVVDNFVQGKTSGATGLVKTIGANPTIEVLSGAFVLEDLFVYTNSTTTSPIVSVTTITALTTRCLSELYPDIVRAVEIEIRYMDKHKHDFENISTIQGQSQRRSYNVQTYTYDLQPEAQALLMHYHLMAIV